MDLALPSESIMVIAHMYDYSLEQNTYGPLFWKKCMGTIQRHHIAIISSIGYFQLMDPDFSRHMGG